MDVCTYITESLCCIPEIKTMLEINYTSIKNKNTILKSMKILRLIENHLWLRVHITGIGISTKGITEVVWFWSTREDAKFRSGDNDQAAFFVLYVQHDSLLCWCH